MKNPFLLSLSLLLFACAPSPTSQPATDALVGRWRTTDGTQYEFTDNGTILIEGGGVATTGKYEKLAGDRCLSTMSSGTQYRFLCRAEGSKLTLQYDGQSATTATKVP